ncbi:MAG: hypothetical protein ACJ76J_26700 [Thermoanaerobaculia bacterium]
MGFAVALLAAVLLGFSRTFFLRPWFSEWARAHGSPEPFFYVHGAVFLAWFVLLLAQSALVATGRVGVHRRLGWLGAGLAAVMVVLGTAGALLAARRPTGFMDVPLPPLQFLVVPLADMALFGGFMALALVKRREAQSHKRYMLLASIAIVDAAVGRWPFAVMMSAPPVPGFSMTDVFVDLFLVPMVVWDLASRGRVHRVTLWGGLALIASQPLRFLLSETGAWLAFASWAVGLLGR